MVAVQPPAPALPQPNRKQVRRLLPTNKNVLQIDESTWQFSRVQSQSWITRIRASKSIRSHVAPNETARARRAFWWRAAEIGPLCRGDPCVVMAWFTRHDVRPRTLQSRRCGHDARGSVQRTVGNRRRICWYRGFPPCTQARVPRLHVDKAFTGACGVATCRRECPSDR